MKTSILSTIVMASLLLFVAGCEKESLLVHQPEKNPGTPAVGSRTLTLSAEMPNNGPTTRIALTQVGKRIDMAWEAGDVLQLCFVQGATKIKRWVEVNNISADGKKASFSIGIPDEIVVGSFDLYGVYGGLGLSESDPTIALLPGIGGAGSLSALSEREDAMLIFSSIGIQTSEPQVSVTFRHLGALFCITLKNNNSVTMNDLGSLRLVSNDPGTWAYNFEGGGSYDLVNDAFLGTESGGGNYLKFISPVSSLAAGESLSIWGWFPPLPTAVWPELSLEIRDGWNAVRVTSDNSKPARSSALSTGKSYYFYAMWDGDALIFTDSTFTPPPTIEDLTLEGDLRHADSGTDFLGMVYLKSGSVYYNEAMEVGQWSGEVLLGVGSDPRIAIDGNDNPHVVYTTTDGRIAYLTRSGGTWSSPVYITSLYGDQCYLPDIEVDGNEYAHISYTDKQGNYGHYSEFPDIMYAQNSSGSFVKTLIFDGYYSDFRWDSTVETYPKGSRIALNAAGQYYILAYKLRSYAWKPNPATLSTSIEVKTNGANGSVGGSADSLSADIYDMAFDGTNLIAFYKEGGVNKTAALTVSETTISFTNVQNVTTSISNNYLNPGTLAVGPDLRGLGGITTDGNYFFAKYATEEMIIHDFVVKDGTVPVVLLMGGNAYVTLTQSDGMIRIGKRVPEE